MCLAAACKGGRWWLLAGVAAAVAALSKYTGLLVLPLLILGAGRRDWRTPWPWAAAEDVVHLSQAGQARPVPKTANAEMA